MSSGSFFKNNTPVEILSTHPKINGYHGVYLFDFLPYFDSIGYLYALESPCLTGCFKIGVTARSPEQRAAEVSKDLNIAEPFRVRAALKLKNFRLAETFAHAALKEFNIEFVKSVHHFIASNTGKPATRTHRSNEVFKCPAKEVEDLFDAAASGNDRVKKFEYEFLADSEKWLLDFERLYPNSAKIQFSWKATNRIMKSRHEQEVLCIQPVLGQEKSDSAQAHLF